MPQVSEMADHTVWRVIPFMAQYTRQVPKIRSLLWCHKAASYRSRSGIGPQFSTLRMGCRSSTDPHRSAVPIGNMHVASCIELEHQGSAALLPSFLFAACKCLQHLVYGKRSNYFGDKWQHEGLIRLAL